MTEKYLVDKTQFDALLDKASGKVQLNEEEQSELANLQSEDPDAWRLKVNEMESNNRKKLTEVLQVQPYDEKVLEEVSNRKAIVKQFQDKNPDLDLSEKNLSEHLPPAIAQKVKSGDVTFEDAVKHSVSAMKAIMPKKSEEDNVEEKETDPDLTSAAGTSTPQQSKDKVDRTDYDNYVL